MARVNCLAVGSLELLMPNREKPDIQSEEMAFKDCMFWKCVSNNTFQLLLSTSGLKLLFAFIIDANQNLLILIHLATFHHKSHVL